MIMLQSRRQIKWIIYIEFYGNNSTGHFFLHIIIRRGYVGTVKVKNLLEEEKQ